MLPFSPKRAAASSLAALCLLLPAPPRAIARQQQQQAPPAPSPQQDDEDVVRVNTQLVQTDVMVFDKSGKFVEGLKPEHFELKVDGREMPINFFDRVQAGAVNEDAQLAAARGLKSPAGGSVLPLDRGRTVVFFVDDLHLGAGSSMRMRKTLLRFIDEEIGQNDWAAVISASGQVGFLQQFTDEKVVLRAAASRINSRPFDTRDGQYPPMTEAHALAIERRDPSVLSYFVDALLKENPYMRREQAENLVAQRANIILQGNGQRRVERPCDLAPAPTRSHRPRGRRAQPLHVGLEQDHRERDRVRIDDRDRGGVGRRPVRRAKLRCPGPDRDRDKVGADVLRITSGYLDLHRFGPFTSLRNRPVRSSLGQPGL